MDSRPNASKPAERIAIATQLVRILGGFGVVVALTDYLQGNLMMAGASALMALCAPLVLLLSRQPRLVALPLHFCTWALFAMFLFGNFTQLPFRPEKTVWVTLFPFAYFYLTGLRNGARWTAACLVLMLLSYPLAPLLLQQPAVTSPYAFSQSIGAFILSALFAYLYERIRTRQADQLETSAAHDELTGLLNRRGFAPLAEAALEQARRFGLPFAVVLIDIDDFKQVNDQHGHATGDRLLADLGALLSQHSRKADLLARWGGEEFILLLLRSTSERALTAAEKMRAAIAGHAFAHGHASASFGVALHAPQETLEATVSRADRALYRAKEAGKNRVEFDSAA